MPAIYEPLPHPKYEHRDYPMQVVHGVSHDGIQIYPGVIVANEQEHMAWLADEAVREQARMDKAKAEAIVADKLSEKP